MDDVFLKLVNLSISASWLILAVLVLRVVLKKAPKWVMPLLWGVVALRLPVFHRERALAHPERRDHPKRDRDGNARAGALRAGDA